MPPPRPTAEEKEAHFRKRTAEWLERVRKHRGILKAVVAGTSAEAVAERYGATVAFVERLAEDAGPSDAKPSVEELVTAAWLDPEADRRALVEMLAAWPYTDDLLAPRGLMGA